MAKYPNVHVKLVGEDGNAFAILGRYSTAARRAGVSKDERDAFTAEATSGDYNHLLLTCMEWFACDEDDCDEDEADEEWDAHWAEMDAK